jgi:hypothetical protein
MLDSSRGNDWWCDLLVVGRIGCHGGELTDGFNLLSDAALRGGDHRLDLEQLVMIRTNIWITYDGQQAWNALLTGWIEHVVPGAPKSAKTRAVAHAYLRHHQSSFGVLQRSWS